MSYPKIYLLRHGQTLWNAAGRFQGQLNSPLSETGREQASAMGQILAREISNPTAYAMHVSPLGRTLETGELIKNHFPFSADRQPRLMEIDFGDWSGMSHYEISQEYPDLLTGHDGQSWQFFAPGGESLADMQARAQLWLASLSGSTIAVSHGLIGRIIRGLILGLDDRQTLALSDRQDGLILLENGAEQFLTL